MVWCDCEEGGCLWRHREPAGGSRELQGIVRRSRFVPGEEKLEESRRSMEKRRVGDEECRF